MFAKNIKFMRSSSLVKNVSIICFLSSIQFRKRMRRNQDRAGLGECGTYPTAPLCPGALLEDKQ